MYRTMTRKEFAGDEKGKKRQLRPVVFAQVGLRDTRVARGVRL